MHLFRLLPRHHYHQCRLSSSTLNGWAVSISKLGTTVFVDVDEGKGREPIQLVVDKRLLEEHRVNVGCAIMATGKIQKRRDNKNNFEFVAEKLRVVGTDSNPRYDVSADKLRKDLSLRTRNPKFAAFLRARSAIFQASHEFFLNREFVHIDTPKLTGNDCEGGGDVFDVVSDSADFVKSKTDGLEGYQPIHLTVSSQLHLEAMTSRLNKVYTLGPAFRAEKQLSNTHLSEFHMLEAEIAFVEKTSDLLKIVEQYLNEMTNFAETSPIVQSYMKNVETTAPKIDEHRTFPRITFEEAVSILNERGEKVTAKSGLSRKNELKLTSIFKDSPVFVTDFPSDQKPFYMARSPDGKTTLSFDLLVPGVGELAGGSVREPDARKLEGRCNIDWYLEMRRRGQPPTGGFGIGFERLLQYLLRVPNIKDTMAFPRWYRHVKC